MGATLHRGARAFHCRGLSCCRAQAPDAQAQQLWLTGPSCSAACGIFPDQGSNPCPLHWQADSQPLHHQGSPQKTSDCWFDKKNSSLGQITIQPPPEILRFSLLTIGHALNHRSTDKMRAFMNQHWWGNIHKAAESVHLARPTCLTCPNTIQAGTSLAVWWLGLHVSNAGGAGSIPGWGAKIPCATWWGQKHLHEKQNTIQGNPFTLLPDTELPHGPLEVQQMDFIQLPHLTVQTCFVMSCMFSHWTKVFPCRQSSASSKADMLLEKIILPWVIPNPLPWVVLHSDRGTHFTGPVL